MHKEIDMGNMPKVGFVLFDIHERENAEWFVNECLPCVPEGVWIAFHDVITEHPAIHSWPLEGVDYLVPECEVLAKHWADKGIKPFLLGPLLNRGQYHTSGTPSHAVWRNKHHNH